MDEALSWSGREFTACLFGLMDVERSRLVAHYRSERGEGS